jgi:hypothetical protein
VAVQTFYANRLDDMNHDRGLESGAMLALGFQDRDRESLLRHKEAKAIAQLFSMRGE